MYNNAMTLLRLIVPAILVCPAAALSAQTPAQTDSVRLGIQLSAGLQYANTGCFVGGLYLRLNPSGEHVSMDLGGRYGSWFPRDARKLRPSAAAELRLNFYLYAFRITPSQLRPRLTRILPFFSLGLGHMWMGDTFNDEDRVEGWSSAEASLGFGGEFRLGDGCSLLFTPFRWHAVDGGGYHIRNGYYGSTTFAFTWNFTVPTGE
jgi:hypothetical protein